MVGLSSLRGSVRVDVHRGDANINLLHVPAAGGFASWKELWPPTALHGQQAAISSLGTLAVLTQSDLVISPFPVSQKGRREAVCYQPNVGTLPLTVISQKTHSHQTLAASSPASHYLFFSPLLDHLFRKNPKQSERAEFGVVTAGRVSVLEWGWKNFKFRIRESHFLWTDKVEGMNLNFHWKKCLRISFLLIP